MNVTPLPIQGRPQADVVPLRGKRGLATLTANLYALFTVPHADLKDVGLHYRLAGKTSLRGRRLSFVPVQPESRNSLGDAQSARSLALLWHDVPSAALNASGMSRPEPTPLGSRREPATLPKNVPTSAPPIPISPASLQRHLEQEGGHHPYAKSARMVSILDTPVPVRLALHSYVCRTCNYKGTPTYFAAKDCHWWCGAWSRIKCCHGPGPIWASAHWVWATRPSRGGGPGRGPVLGRSLPRQVPASVPARARAGRIASYLLNL